MEANMADRGMVWGGMEKYSLLPCLSKQYGGGEGGGTAHESDSDITQPFKANESHAE
jgi:hypothetical protein